MSRYTVKVRKSSNKTFLWGGDGITKRLNSPLFLTFRVVDMGESINFGIYKSGVDGGTPEEVPLGVLKESETFTIHLLPSHCKIRQAIRRRNESNPSCAAQAV